MIRRLRTGWLGCALIAGAMPFLAQDYAPLTHGRALGIALLALGCAALAAHGLRRGGLRLALLLPLAALMAAWSLDAWLRPFEAGSHPTLPAFSAFAEGLARLAGEPASRDGGELLLQDPQGAIRVAASWGAAGWRPLCAFAVLAAAAGAGRPRAARAWLAGVLAALLFAALRFAAHALHYAGVEEVMVQGAHPAVREFYEPWGVLAALLLAALVAERVAGDDAGPDAAAPRALAPPLAFAAVAGLALGAAWAWTDPGTPKRGRVMVDERLTGAWEPAGRMLDTGRYGDFSAYSLSAMVEQLSRRWSVEVNSERRYDAELLAGVDVLVLKTPERALDPDELAAIRAWLEDGGGLFLISDHTDLLGMSTHLRPLAAPYGIDFAFDAVNDAAGGFNLWTGGGLPEHPVTAGLGPIEFMTGCSLRTRGAARPLLILRRATSMAGDYSLSSHFGNRAPHAGDPQGLLIAAAAAPAGRGRILAFGDSTILSSFAWPLYARAEFVSRGIAWLDRRASAARHLRWAWLLLGAAAAALAARRARGAGAAGAAALLAGIAAGGAAGAWSAAAVGASALRIPEPSPDVPRIGFVVEGGHAALPPVLGDRPDGLPDFADFATFLQVPLRLGLEAEVTPREPGALARLDALVLLNPDVELGQPEAPAGWTEAVREWVADGGRLLVLQRASHLGHPHDRAPLYGEGLSFARVESGSADLELSVAEAGRGRVVRAVGSEALALEGLGHCMQFPGRREREHYEVAYRIFGQVMGLGMAERRTWRPR